MIIAESFQKSLSKLDKQSQDQIKINLYDFQNNPKTPSFQFHRIDTAKDKNLFSIRVNQDIRIIVYKDGDNYIFCYTDHHDDSYKWAEKRVLNKNESSGIVQFVKIEEIEQKIIKKIEEIPPMFSHLTEDYLLKIGVPSEYIDYVLSITNVDDIYNLIDCFSDIVVEKLIDIAYGKPVETILKTQTDIYNSADSMKRFCVVKEEDELRKILDEPLEKWVVFLHPEQRKIVEKEFNGVVKISGSAGTGKTVVALHRTEYIAKKYTDKSILLTTFSKTLAYRLERNMHLLTGKNETILKNVTITNLHKIAYSIYTRDSEDFKLLGSYDKIYYIIKDFVKNRIYKFPEDFLLNEWKYIIEPWNIKTFDQYKKISRAGRGSSLGLIQKKEIWKVFDHLLSEMKKHKLITWADIFYSSSQIINENEKFDCIRQISSG